MKSYYYTEKEQTIPLEGVYYGYYNPNSLITKQVKIVSEEQPTLTMFYWDLGIKTMIDKIV